MKKTVTVNINGRAFTIDEDAYSLLENYLKNLRIYFRKEEGVSEIIADFEARIEELLREYLQNGKQIISINQVEEVISRVGKPTDFAEGEETAADEEKRTFHEEFRDFRETGTNKKFYRNTDDKMLGGLCSGVAAYFGWDVLAVRLITVVLAFATFPFVVPVYIIAWLIFPAANTAEEKLQMRGKPITVENIGKTVSAAIEKTKTENKGCLSQLLNFIVGLIKIFIVCIGFLIVIPLVFALFVVIIVLLIALFGIGGGLVNIFPFEGVSDCLFYNAVNPTLVGICLILLIGIPVFSLIYGLISYLAKLNPLNKIIKWTLVIVWFLALILCISSGFKLTKHGFHHFLNWKWDGLIWDSERTLIHGNGHSLEKTYITEPFEYFEANGIPIADFRIEQIDHDENSLLIKGDENLVDKIEYKVIDNKLRLSTPSYTLQSKNDLIVVLRTKELKEIHIEKGGTLTINNPYKAETLDIWMRGAGNLKADSLDIKTLKVKTEGVASATLAGHVRKAVLNMEGTGHIDAFELASDSVVANVDGIGSIECNATEYLKGRLYGIGKIRYKEEPKIKDMSSRGIGKIGKE